MGLDIRRMPPYSSVLS